MRGAFDLHKARQGEPVQVLYGGEWNDVLTACWDQGTLGEYPVRTEAYGWLLTVPDDMRMRNEVTQWHYAIVKLASHDQPVTIIRTSAQDLNYEINRHPGAVVCVFGEFVI